MNNLNVTIGPIIENEPVPRPGRHLSPLHLAVKEMRVGDCREFTFPHARGDNNLHRVAAVIGYKVTVRRMPAGQVKCWRVA